MWNPINGAVDAVAAVLLIAIGGLIGGTYEYFVYEGLSIPLPIIGEISVIDGRADKIRDRAVASMVSQARLLAEQAKAEGWKKIAEKRRELASDAQERAAAIERANKTLRASLGRYNADNANLQDQINVLLSHPIDNSCVVDESLADKLRGR